MIKKVVIIQDNGDYYSHLTQENITDKIVDKNVIIAEEMKEEDFPDKFGFDATKYALRKESRHLVRTDKGLLFFDEETGEKILLK